MAYWVKIEDKLPPDNVEVIGWDGFRMLVVELEHCGANKEIIEWFWRDEGLDDNWDGSLLTHWLEGVQPPKE